MMKDLDADEEEEEEELGGKNSTREGKKKEWVQKHYTSRQDTYHLRPHDADGLQPNIR